MGIFSFWRKKTLQTDTETTNNVFPHSMPEDIRQILKSLAQNHSEAFMKKLAQEKPDFNGQSSDIQYIAVLLHDDVMASLQNDRLKEYIYEGTTPQEIPTLQSIAPIQVPPVVETYKSPAAWTYSLLSVVAAVICFAICGPLGFGRNNEVCLFSALIGAITAPAIGVWLTFGESRRAWAQTLLTGCMIGDTVSTLLVQNFQFSTFWKESSNKKGFLALVLRIGIGILLWFLLGLLKRKKTVDLNQLHMTIHSQYLNQLCSIISFLKMTSVRFTELNGRIIALNEEIVSLRELVKAQGNLPQYASQAVPHVQGLWQTTDISQISFHVRNIAQHFRSMGFEDIPTEQLPWPPFGDDEQGSSSKLPYIIIWQKELKSKYDTIGFVFEGNEVEVHSEPVVLNGVIQKKGAVHSLR